MTRPQLAISVYRVGPGLYWLANEQGRRYLRQLYPSRTSIDGVDLDGLGFVDPMTALTVANAAMPVATGVVGQVSSVVDQGGKLLGKLFGKKKKKKKAKAIAPGVMQVEAAQDKNKNTDPGPAGGFRLTPTVMLGGAAAAAALVLLMRRR